MLLCSFNSGEVWWPQYASIYVLVWLSKSTWSTAPIMVLLIHYREEQKTTNTYGVILKNAMTYNILSYYAPFFDLDVNLSHNYLERLLFTNCRNNCLHAIKRFKICSKFNILHKSSEYEWINSKWAFSAAGRKIGYCLYKPLTRVLDLFKDRGIQVVLVNTR